MTCSRTTDTSFHGLLALRGLFPTSMASVYKSNWRHLWGELRGRSIVWLHRMTKGRNGEQRESLVEMAWTGDARRSWPLRVSYGPLLCGRGSEIWTLAAGVRNLITFSDYMPDPQADGEREGGMGLASVGRGMFGRRLLRARVLRPGLCIRID